MDDLVEPVEVEIAGERPLAVLADELGHDDVLVVSMSFARPNRDLVLPKMTKWYALGDRDQFGYAPIVAEDEHALGSRKKQVSYTDIAKDIYKHLKNGETLSVAGRKFRADDVPRFMIECVLNGIA